MSPNQRNKGSKVTAAPGLRGGREAARGRSRGEAGSTENPGISKLLAPGTPGTAGGLFKRGHFKGSLACGRRCTWTRTTAGFAF